MRTFSGNHFSGWVFLGHAGRMEVAALCVLMEGTPLLTPVLSLEFLAVEPTGCVCLQAPGPKGVTVPKPFNLSEGNKRKREEAASEYVSLAQQVENFQKRTPLRYHLRSRKEGDGKGLGGLAKTLFCASPEPALLMGVFSAGVSQRRPLKAMLTHPQTPHFETKSRSRPITCKSAAELEAEQVAELQQ